MRKLFAVACISLFIAAAVDAVAGNGARATERTPQALVAAAYTAMGLNDPKADPLTIVITKGTMKQWDPGGSESVADLLKPDLGTATFTNVWDRTHNSSRTEWVRPRFISGTRNYTEVYTPAGGYVTGIDVNSGLPRRTIQNGQSPPLHTMSAVRLRALLREQARNQIVILMHEHPERLSSLPDQTSGGKSYPAVQYQDDNGTYIVMFDPATHLPAVVRTRDFDAHMGDANYDATYSDWRGVGSNGRFKQPFRIIYTLNGVSIFDVTVEQIRINEPLSADTFAAPPQLEGRRPPAAAEKTPFQWVIRRLANGFYLDSDALYMDEGSMLALTDVGPNISLVTGGSHNTLIVATDDALVAFDAPGDDGLTNWTIDAARQKYPGKPFRYVVLTHHHLDHTGGIRAYAAQGAAIVVGKGDGDYFRKVLAAPQTLNVYGTKPITSRVLEVDGKWSETVGGRVIEAYSLDNSHATGYLIPYIPDAKMAFQTDLWITGMQRVPADPAFAAFVNGSARAIVNGLQKAGVTPEKLAGGHGAVGDYGDLVKYVELLRADQNQTPCAALVKLALPHAKIIETQAIASGTFQAPDGQSYEVPAFCRIQGLSKPTADSDIHFEVWLPASGQWNGRYYQHGEGGGGGSINYAALADFVRNGAAGAATDDGRKSGLFRAKDVNDAYQERREERNHPEKVIDNAYRALGETVKSAKALARAYYGKAPRHSYFAGCSGGGSYAWKAARRFPQEWDGILVGAPSNNATGFFAANIWNSRRWLDPQSRILPGKLPAIERAALASCAPQAHVVNGIATDPRFCPFDPAALTCKGDETDECLTAPQIETLRAIYAGPRNPRTAQQLYPGFPAAAEFGWTPFISATPGQGFLGGIPLNLYSANGFVQFVFGDPNGEERIKAFDFDGDIGRVENMSIGSESLKSVMNATDADWTALRKRGVKIAMYFGWSDSALTPLEGIRYYETVARSLGGFAKTQEFFRLFMVPGMGHCGGGPGANSFGQWYASKALRNDATHSISRALEAWVETGRPPDRVIAAKYIDDDSSKGVAFTRPLCPYPQIAVYEGSGRNTDASSFNCKTEATH